MAKPRPLDLKDQGRFNFNRNWFRTRNLSTYREYVYPYWSTHPHPITYLEIGVFEAMSFVWMLQHLLRDPQDRAIGVDPWLATTKLDQDYMDQVRANAKKNVEIAGAIHGGAVTQLIRMNSAEFLNKMNDRRRRVKMDGIASKLRPGTLDLCLIDGNHWAPYVADDARLVLRLLKPGGWMLFDDYENDKPKENHVKAGVELFLEQHGGEVEHLWTHKYMIAFQKK